METTGKGNRQIKVDTGLGLLGSPGLELRGGVRTESGAPAGDTGGATAAVAVVIESETSEIIQEMRRGTAGVLGAAVAMILITAVMTTWGARRWLTGPVERVASAARCLQAGERPPATLTSHLCRRDDEIGSLARSFDDMTEDVLARHEELQALVAARTQWLQQANDKLSEAHERVEQELALAKRVQESLAPREHQSRKNIRLHSRITPAMELGGDFLIIEERGEREFFLAICDVSGKGVAAALFMAIAQAAVDAAAANRKDPGRIAEDANRRLCAANSAAMFVTGVIGRLDGETGHLEYVCAGHEPPIVRRADGSLDKLQGTGVPPLGLEPNQEYAKRTHQMEPGETIVAYTDGVTDACNPSEEWFGENRLTDLVRTADHEAGDRMLDEIWNTIDLFSKPMAPTDDKTCLILQRCR